jgi:hypothetical protein
MRKKYFTISFLFFFFSSTAQKNYPRMKATVEFNVYSGLPNPKWDLTGKECAELLKQLAPLPPSKKIINDGGLGYSGFTVNITTDSLKNTTLYARVYKGIISVDAAGIKKNYKDLHHLEKWLMAQASKKGYGSILKNTQ